MAPKRKYARKYKQKIGVVKKKRGKKKKMSGGRGLLSWRKSKKNPRVFGGGVGSGDLKILRQMRKEGLELPLLNALGYGLF